MSHEHSPCWTIGLTRDANLFQWNAEDVDRAGLMEDVWVACCPGVHQATACHPVLSSSSMLSLACQELPSMKSCALKLFTISAMQIGHSI